LGIVRTQYLRRKVVIPLELPTTVREVASIRNGLRKRKRADCPESKGVTGFGRMGGRRLSNMETGQFTTFEIRMGA
jgi:hypothetical protein